MVNIRNITLDDIDDLHTLGESVSEFSVSNETVIFWPESTLRSAVASNDVLLLAAWDDTKLVGFIIASYSDGLKKAVIENVFVTPDYRGQHIGDDLLAQLIQDLGERGCEYIATLIPPDAIGALGLYENAGFATGETFLWLDKPLSDGFKVVVAE